MNKKLYRSRKDRMLGGVAAGLGEYFEIDPTLVRIIFVASLIFGGAGLFAYIIMWIIVPEEPFPNSSPQNTESGEHENNQNSESSLSYQESLNEQKRKRRTILGAILIILGFIFLADNYIPRFDFSDIFPLILVIVGIAILVNIKRN